MIVFACTCGQKLSLDDQFGGRKVRCPKCQTLLTAPPGTSESAPLVVEPMAGEPQEAIAPRGSAAPPPPPRREEYREGRPRGGAPGGYDEDPDPPRRARREGAYRPPERTSGLALTSMILGAVCVLVGLVLSLFLPMWAVAFPGTLALAAVVTAILGMKQVGRGEGRVGGNGLAISGMITGVLGLVLFFPGFLVKAAMGRSANRIHLQNNLKQVGLAMHGYHDSHRRLPDPGMGRPGMNTRHLSWRVHLLPYIEQDMLYRQFNLDEPWDGPNNIRLLDRMPKIYAPMGKEAPKGHTCWQVFVGRNTIWPEWGAGGKLPPPGPGFGMPPGKQLFTMVDGTSNTFLVAESGTPVPWTKPADIDLDQAPGMLPPLGWSDPRGFWVVLGDGSTRFVDRARTSDQTIRLLIDPRDGNPIPGDF